MLSCGYQAEELCLQSKNVYLASLSKAGSPTTCTDIAWTALQSVPRLGATFSSLCGRGHLPCRSQVYIIHRLSLAALPSAAATVGAAARQ